MPLLVPSNEIIFHHASKYILTVVFIAGSWLLFWKISAILGDPVIDEIFHLRQCQKYCQYKFKEWDNKITTPPGLYVLGFLYSKFLGIFFDYDVCGNYNMLRSLNLVGGTIVLPMILNKVSLSFFWPINIAAQPLLFTFFYLFYTDVWSTILVVGSLVVVLQNSLHSTFRYCLSGFVGFLSLWLRQTNIAWLGFVFSVAIDHTVTDQKVFEKAFKILKILPKNWKICLPYSLNFLAFVIFLKLNGGITFGDKENHQINLHLVQIFYCFTFVTFFTWPTWISRKTLRAYSNFCFSSTINLVLNCFAGAFIKLIVDKFTIIHPFLLADNRHFTFYIFKRIISHRYSNVISIPVYHFSVWLVSHMLYKSKRLKEIPVICYFIASCLTLIPSPLFEPRYYIVPLVFFRIFIKPVNNRRHILEFLWLSSVNIITMGIFINYEFTWPSEPNVIQRIIW
ncbi:uncharacterized protein PRCAT00005365001 [Priceomyces carsonii]|uniref:uncharacterized protein n=1 Tax=Priceomyces carsonii TaxID=28549 RepID=UPI002EDA8493|nr:unnamed protein product [Priceomyces carsonii]